MFRICVAFAAIIPILVGCAVGNPSEPETFYDVIYKVSISPAGGGAHLSLVTYIDENGLDQSVDPPGAYWQHDFLETVPSGTQLRITAQGGGSPNQTMTATIEVDRNSWKERSAQVDDGVEVSGTLP